MSWVGLDDGLVPLVAAADASSEHSSSVPHNEDRSWRTWFWGHHPCGPELNLETKRLGVSMQNKFEGNLLQIEATGSRDYRF